MSKRHMTGAYGGVVMSSGGRLVELSGGRGAEWVLRHPARAETSASEVWIPPLDELDAFMYNLNLWRTASCGAQAVGLEAEAHQLAQAFAARVSAIREVKVVALDLSTSQPVVTTYIAQRDLDVRSLIYAAEHEIYQEFPLEDVEFQVKSLDTPGCKLPAPDSPHLRVIYESR